MRLRSLFGAAAFAAAGLVATAGQTTQAATVGDFEVDFLDVSYNIDGTSTWTYKVTSDADTKTKALSHWTLQLCDDAVVVSPIGSYTTLSSFTDGGGDTFTGRADITYTVVLGLDATSGVSGIKYEDAVDASGDTANLGENGVMEMDLFQFTLDQHYVVDNTVLAATKAGGAVDTATILGPSLDCHTQTVVVPTPAASGLGAGLLGLMVLAKARKKNA